MKASLKQEKEMAKVLSGGPTVAGMRESSEMGFRVAGEFCIGKVVIANMKGTGTTVCLTAKELSTSKTDSVMTVLLRRTNSTVRAFFTKMTQSYMEYGKIISCQW